MATITDKQIQEILARGTAEPRGDIRKHDTDELVRQIRKDIGLNPVGFPAAVAGTGALTGASIGALSALGNPYNKLTRGIRRGLKGSLIGGGIGLGLGIGGKLIERHNVGRSAQELSKALQEGKLNTPMAAYSPSYEKLLRGKINPDTAVDMTPEQEQQRIDDYVNNYVSRWGDNADELTHSERKRIDTDDIKNQLELRRRGWGGLADIENAYVNEKSSEAKTGMLRGYTKLSEEEIDPSQMLQLLQGQQPEMPQQQQAAPQPLPQPTPQAPEPESVDPQESALTSDILMQQLQEEQASGVPKQDEGVRLNKIRLAKAYESQGADPVSAMAMAEKMFDELWNQHQDPAAVTDAVRQLAGDQWAQQQQQQMAQAQQPAQPAQKPAQKPAPKQAALRKQALGALPVAAIAGAAGIGAGAIGHAVGKWRGRGEARNQIWDKVTTPGSGSAMKLGGKKKPGMDSPQLPQKTAYEQGYNDTTMKLSGVV